MTIHLLTSLPPLHLLLYSRHAIVAQPNRQVLLCIIRSLTLCSKRTSVSTSWTGQILSDLQWYPFCICIQPLVDFLRGNRDCSFGFPKQYQSLLGYTCLQSLFSSLPLFGPSFDWDHSWVSTPLSFQLAIQLSLTAPTFNTQIVRYIDHFNDYGFAPSEEPKIQLPDDQKPWYPFQSQVDFGFTEIAIKSHLNKKAVNTLISIVKACSSGQASFTLDSHEEMWELLHGASSKLTSVWYLNYSFLFLFVVSSSVWWTWHSNFIQRHLLYKQILLSVTLGLGHWPCFKSFACIIVWVGCPAFI